MSIIDRFLIEGGGDFATAKNTPVGSEIIITHVYFDNQTFPDNPAIVTNGTRANGDEVKVRLSKQNVARIAQVLGTDEKAWIGNRLKALTHQDYPGLGKTGILWTGVRVGMQPPVDMRKQTPPALDKPQVNDLSTAAHSWVLSNMSLIGQQIPADVWNDMRQKGIVKDLAQYSLIEMRDDYPYLSEEARNYL